MTTKIISNENKLVNVAGGRTGTTKRVTTTDKPSFIRVGTFLAPNPAIIIIIELIRTKGSKKSLNH